MSSSAAAAAADIEPGSVVWLDLSNDGYPWWPAKVEREEKETIFVCFQDESRYQPGTMKPRAYNCAEVHEMITKGKHKLRHRKATLQHYCQALEEAEKHVQAHLDSTFTFKSHSKPTSTMGDKGDFSNATPCSDSASHDGIGDQNLTPANLTPARPNMDSGKKSASKGKRKSSGKSSRKSSGKTPKKVASSSKDDTPAKESKNSSASKDPSSAGNEAATNNGEKNNKKRKLSAVDQGSEDGAETAPSKNAELDKEEAAAPSKKAKLDEEVAAAPSKKAKLDGDEAAPSKKAKLDGGEAAPSKKAKLDGEEAAPSKKAKLDGGEAAPSKKAKAAPSKKAKLDGGEAAPSKAAKLDGGEAEPSKKAKLDGEEAAPSKKAKLDGEEASKKDGEEAAPSKAARLDGGEATPSKKAKLGSDNGEDAPPSKKAKLSSDDGENAPPSKKAKLDSDALGTAEKATTSAPWKQDPDTRAEVWIIGSNDLDPTKPFQATDAGEGSTAAKEREEEADPSQPVGKDEANSTIGGGGKEGQVSVAGNGSPLEDIAGASVSSGSGQVEDASSCRMTNSKLTRAAVNIPPQGFSSPIIPTTTPASARKYRLSCSSDESLHLDSESEEEEWPCLDLSVNENIKIHQLQPKDVVWVKYQNYPFWPAIVSTVKAPKKKKSTSTANVFFFGYDEPCSTKVTKSQNVCHFGTERKDGFIREGKKQPGMLKMEFEQALDEAQSFFMDVGEGKWTKETPKQVMQEVSKLRPLSYVSRLGPPSGQGTATPLTPDVQPGLMRSVTPPFIPSWMDTADSDDGRGESTGNGNGHDNEEEEDDDSFFPYTYERVASEIEILEPVLMCIMRGEMASSFHRIFLYGSRREQALLKHSAKYGPIKKWPPGRVSTLINTVLTKMARKVEGRNFRFTYAHDVLLPEAMYRVKAKVENIPLERAIEDFEK